MSISVNFWVGGSSIAISRLDLVDREHLRRQQVGALLAVVGIVGAADAGRVPDPRLFIQHQAVRDGLRGPQLLVAPIGRRRIHLGRAARGRLRIAHRNLHARGDALDRIENRHVVGAVLGRAIERPIGVDGGIALVGGDLVVQVGLGSRPVPYRDDDIALDSLRARRLGGRQLALGDPVGPIAEHASGRARCRNARWSRPCPCWPGRTGSVGSRPHSPR